MKLVIFGLTVSSSWGNGHATLWRGLCRALARLGHDVVFFERNVPYYAENRDLAELPHGTLVLYDHWDSVKTRAAREIAEADVAMTTSYCPDAVAASVLMTEAQRPVRVFYDLDTPVTLSQLASGETLFYIGRDGLSSYDLVLSFTGGRALDELSARLGARRVRPLYGHVDPDVHRPAPPQPHYAADLSYLGTYARDRQAKVENLFLTPAASLPDRRFVIGGAQYPSDFPWLPNVHFVRHLPPSEHSMFFSSSRFTLNVTRTAMAEMGWCPSGRLFEAAACGAAIVSDWWPGVDSFFSPGSEIVIAECTRDVIRALQLDDAETDRLARAGRDRTLAEHTSEHRARQLIEDLESARTSHNKSFDSVEAA
jgi:spore maturation protein CgeB